VEPFERLFRDEYSRVVGIAYRVLADRQEAEDVAQEVFVDFHRLHRADAPYAGAWLHRAAASTALNAVRSRNRRTRREANYGRLEMPRSEDPAEVAKALGVKIGQIGTLLRRAEAMLRREVDDATSR